MSTDCEVCGKRQTQRCPTLVESALVKARPCGVPLCNGCGPLCPRHTPALDWWPVQDGRIVPERLHEPWHRKPPSVFALRGDLFADLFQAKLTNEHVATIFAVMAACDRHTFQLTTYNPDALRAWMAWVDKDEYVGQLHTAWGAYVGTLKRPPKDIRAMLRDDDCEIGHAICGGYDWPLDHVTITEQVPCPLCAPAGPVATVRDSITGGCLGCGSQRWVDRCRVEYTSKGPLLDMGALTDGKFCDRDGQLWTKVGLGIFSSEPS